MFGYSWHRVRETHLFSFVTSWIENRSRCCFGDCTADYLYIVYWRKPLPPHERSTLSISTIYPSNACALHLTEMRNNPEVYDIVEVVPCGQYGIREIEPYRPQQAYYDAPRISGCMRAILKHLFALFLVAALYYTPAPHGVIKIFAAAIPHFRAAR